MSPPASPNRRRRATHASEVAAGRAAAERLSDEWPDTSWVPEAPAQTWADAAVERFAELIREQRAIFRASQTGASRGAASLSPRPFQGIVEALQNADDLAANELRVAVRKRGRTRELLMAHDGDRVRLDHVGAMVLPWLTTKEDDPDASGRFGIGQETLRALGGPLEVHCAPFQFRIAPDGPVTCGSVQAIKGVYAPARHDTVFIVPLDRSVDVDALEAFVAKTFSARTLLFLRHVRRISLIELSTARRIVDHRLVAGERERIRLPIGGRRVDVERLELSDPRRRQRYRRYLADVPLSADQQRHHKATGITTPVGVAIPLERHETGGFYDRIPLPTPCGFSFGLNAQFDPDAPRSTLLENEWNRHRVKDIGSLLPAAALDAFKLDGAPAWRAIPLADDVVSDPTSWLAEQLQGSVVAVSQSELKENLRLKLHGRWRTLRELAYEDERLDGLLTASDLRLLGRGTVGVTPELRDPEGRWRRVLSELGLSHRISVEDALELFEQTDKELGERDPRWYVGMAGAAIAADLLEEFVSARTVLLADGRRIEPPGANDPRTLVRSLDTSSLGAHLDVALPVHPAYLEDSRSAARVVAKLSERKLLMDSCDSADAVLGVLARDYSSNTIGRVPIRDDQLISLRDAFERLGDTEQKRLGASMGQNIELRGFTFEWDGELTETSVCPAEAYLPATIDRERDSFARAARDTPNIEWLARDYATVLKREGGRRELGAQRFLSRLGAAIAPRLEQPSNESTPWKRDPRPASKIESVWPPRPKLQVLEIEALSPRRRYLLNDRRSPDLDTVISSICDESDEEAQRRRGVALLGVLARSWGHYADHQSAQAVYASDGYWLEPREVIATWLARAATEPWLPNADGGMSAPSELCLPTEANRLEYSGEDSMFLADVADDVLHSPALVGLRLRRGPSASDLVGHLERLRERPVTSDVVGEARMAYKLLALLCPPEGVRRPVDDMSLAELRSAFGGSRSRRGLVLADGRWYPPGKVFRGDNIFGRRRPFAPGGPLYAPLWRTLSVPEPDAATCVEVLRELARGSLGSEDKATILATMRVLAEKLDDLPARARGRLSKLPLWTGKSWRDKRPIFAVEDLSLTPQVSAQVHVWDSGFSSYDRLSELLHAMKVDLLRLGDFSELALDGRALVAGEDLRARFALAVEHLRDELMRGDQALHDALEVSWHELAGAHVVVQDDLQLTTDRASRKIVVDAPAHLRRDPLAFMVRSAEDAGRAEGGGRAIAALFHGDRQKVAWAWAVMWRLAGDNVASEGIVLPGGTTDPDDGAERLIQLQGQASRRGRRRGRRSAQADGDGQPRSAKKEVAIRRLKDLAELEPDGGTMVNRGASPTSGIVFRRPAGASASSGDGIMPPRDNSGGTPGQGDAGRDPPDVLPPVETRERLALDAVKDALRLDPPQIADLRARRGIGADMVDELAQFYEIKMSSASEFPAEITLTPSERSRSEDPDFFLAVVAGLEEDADELRVRFIFDPLSQLAVRITGDVTLTGVRGAQALEYRFKKSR
jgi:hypothetical protein